MKANIVKNINYIRGTEYERKIIDILSKYTYRLANDDGSVEYEEMKTAYFIKNDNWHISFFQGIEQFEKQTSNLINCPATTNFRFDNPKVNMEMKFIVHSKVFSDEWKLSTAFDYQQRSMKYLAEFINDKFPEIHSILDLERDKVDLQWIDWLKWKGLKTNSKSKKVGYGEYPIRSSIAGYFGNMYDYLYNFSDVRDEWEKDRWDVRNLQKYGITYCTSRVDYYIDFSKMKNDKLRNSVKKYVKQRLITGNKFSWNTARAYMTNIPHFINYLCDLEPSWDDLRNLERVHILKYLEWLNLYAQKNKRQKNSNPKYFISRNITLVSKFLSDLQMWEYDIAPEKNTRMLVLPTDKPLYKKKPNDQIDYIPEYVLDQLFENLDNLHKDVVPVVLLMFNTGLRISDVLGLQQDCLVKLNGKYWIETDIEKTYVQGHRLPITDEIAAILASLIKVAKENSNQDNNPDCYIFIRYRGARKGKTYSQGWIQDHLNQLAIDCNITNELGNRYHFKNHAFRHNYAMALLNGGTDLLTVQELLAHASPEMTMRYARLLDDTKRKAFDNAVSKGVFSFDERVHLKEENDGCIPSNVLDMLWTNHKLNAIDTPYGTCLQRLNGKCEYAKQPPCLTSNKGNPCKDLCIGAFEGDHQKYEIIINSTQALIESAKTYNREKMKDDNEEILNLYKDIYSTISVGNIIYGRMDRVKIKGDQFG